MKKATSLLLLVTVLILNSCQKEPAIPPDDKARDLELTKALSAENIVTLSSHDIENLGMEKERLVINLVKKYKPFLKGKTHELQTQELYDIIYKGTEYAYAGNDPDYQMKGTDCQANYVSDLKTCDRNFAWSMVANGLVSFAVGVIGTPAAGGITWIGGGAIVTNAHLQCAVTAIQTRQRCVEATNTK